MSERYIIANAAGFWGDRTDVLGEQVRGGPVDVVMLDYLAEITMSILRKQKQRDPTAGYARDFLVALDGALPELIERGVKVVTNAGGINPRGLAEAAAQRLAERGHRGVPIAVVSGDDVLDALEAVAASAPDGLANMDGGAAFSSIADRVLSANVYLGAGPIAEALQGGAQLVITGRCTDSALALGPLWAHHGWTADDYDRLAAGIVAGHVIECGGQASGGNFAGGWSQVPRLAELGYPLAEVAADGDMIITKHPSLGGLVTPAVIKEQLLYEIGDPARYLTPDVTADFTSIELEDLGDNRVRISGVTGTAPPAHLKISIGYQAGYKNMVALTFVWPDAVERARATEQLLLERCTKLGLRIEAHHVDLIGLSGAHGPMAPAAGEQPNEVLFRMAIRTSDRDSAVRFGAEMAPLITSGLPGACSGNMTGRPAPEIVVDHWPALVARDCVTPRIERLSS
jgi:Acyclic terpene utilisation family protein AtuA